MRLLAPAKINRFLAVAAPDARGYHPLRTEFQAIGLYDEVEVRFDGSGVTFEGMEVPRGNTVSRTVERLAPLIGQEFGVHVGKRIPDRAGFGGGSSDAAAVLRAVRSRSPDAVSAEDAFEIAREIGADVPFFLVGGRAWGEGYGERLTPWEDGPRRWILAALPPESGSTAEMFRRLDEVPRLAAVYQEGVLHNDFEGVTDEGSRALLTEWRGNGWRASLTGSGSAVFAEFATKEEAEAAAAQAATGRAVIRAQWVVPSLSRAESLALSPPESPRP